MDRNKTHGAPSWLEYNGKDPAVARKFYTEVLGWTVNDMPMGDGGNYPVITFGEEGVGGFSPQPQEPSGWLTYITVDDVDARFKKAIDAGAKTILEPFDGPGVGRMCRIEDPSGALLAFIKYAS